MRSGGCNPRRCTAPLAALQLATAQQALQGWFHPAPPLLPPAPQRPAAHTGGQPAVADAGPGHLRCARLRRRAWRGRPRLPHITSQGHSVTRHAPAFPPAADFGIGRARKAAERFVSAFEESYYLRRVRVFGDDVRILRCYPGLWQVRGGGWLGGKRPSKSLCCGLQASHQPEQTGHGMPLLAIAPCMLLSVQTSSPTHRCTMWPPRPPPTPCC